MKTHSDDALRRAGLLSSKCNAFIYLPSATRRSEYSVTWCPAPTLQNAGFAIKSPDEFAPTLKKAMDLAGPDIPVDYSHNVELGEQMHPDVIV
jgi:hypothetical protein